MTFWEELWNSVCSFFEQYVFAPFMNIDVFDVIDILVLATVLYYLYRFSHTRRAGRVLAGLIVVVLAGLIAILLELPALSYLIRLFAVSFFFCFVLIFQPEIRDALERIGNSRFVNPLSDTLPQKKLPAAKQIVDETVDAVFKMSDANIGALIVFEGLTRLGDVAESGKIVDAKVASHTIRTIFHDKTPLHDGALIIRDMRIWKASCVLPSTKSHMDFGNMGTRHRAAVGITEVSDALVIVVSEQTGTVSVAQDGILVRGVDAETLRDILMTYIAGSLYLNLKKKDAKAARTASEMAELAERRAASGIDKQVTPGIGIEEPDADLSAQIESSGKGKDQA